MVRSAFNQYIVDSFSFYGLCRFVLALVVNPKLDEALSSRSGHCVHCSALEGSVVENGHNLRRYLTEYANIDSAMLHC